MKKFFKDLFMMPGENGERRLVKNFLTRKMVWTRGVEPSGLKTTREDFLKEKDIYVDRQEIKNEDKLIHVSNSVAFEPMKGNRFIVRFSDVEPYFIQSYEFLGESEGFTTDSRYVSSLTTILPLNPTIALEDKLLSMKGKDIGEVKIDLLDPTGYIVRTILLKDVVVDEVNVLDSLDYGADEILKAFVLFSHSEREILIPN